MPIRESVPQRKLYAGVALNQAGRQYCCMMMGCFPDNSKFPRAAIRAASKHLFLCIGPDCCSEEGGESAWLYLKVAVQRTGIPILRSKVGCLRICSGGPWLVVYPEGVWYGEITPERIDRILNEHVIQGRAVLEWASAQTGLPCVDFEAGKISP